MVRALGKRLCTLLSDIGWQLRSLDIVDLVVPGREMAD